MVGRKASPSAGLSWERERDREGGFQDGDKGRCALSLARRVYFVNLISSIPAGDPCSEARQIQKGKNPNTRSHVERLTLCLAAA